MSSDGSGDQSFGTGVEFLSAALFNLHTVRFGALRRKGDSRYAAHGSGFEKDHIVPSGAYESIRVSASIYVSLVI